MIKTKALKKHKISLTSKLPMKIFTKNLTKKP